MKITTYLLLSFFSLSLVSNLAAQCEKKHKKKSSLEIKAQAYRGYVPANTVPIFASDPFVLDMDPVVDYSNRMNPEIQIKYVREIVNDFSAYGALSYGSNLLFSSFRIYPTSDPALAANLQIVYNKHKATYGASSLGARYTWELGGYSSFSFSLGGKGIYYPVQDLNLTDSGFAINRGQEYSFELKSNLEASSKFVIGAELEIAYHLKFTKLPVDMVYGVTADYVRSDVLDLDSQITLGNNTLDFSDQLGGARIGLFAGFTYDFGG